MALDYLKTIFGALILSNQNCFSSEEGWEELLKAVPDSRAVDTLRTKWEANSSRSSEDKWSDLFKQANARVKNIHYYLPPLLINIMHVEFHECIGGHHYPIYLSPAGC
jgi:3-dehydroquinate dehydratase